MNYALFGRQLTELFSISDDQLAREHAAKQRLQRAIAEMQMAIQDVNASSALVRIDAETFDNLVHDEFPSFEAWEEKIAEARH